MKFYSLTFAALLSVMPLAGVAHAQNFDGPSIGAQAGWVENKLRNPTTDLGVASIDASKDSAVLGAYIGYDKEFGRFVLGAETGISFGTSDTVSGVPGANLVTIDPKRTFDASARAGYLVTSSTLVYARGGYTNERIRTTINSAAGSRIASENRDGWLVGGGIEQVLIPHLSARLEYRYADLREGDGKYDRNQVLTGITYRF